MVICLEQGANLHVAQLMPLPLIVCYFTEIQTGFTFQVPAHPSSPGRRAVCANSDASTDHTAQGVCACLGYYNIGAISCENK